MATPRCESPGLAGPHWAVDVDIARLPLYLDYPILLFFGLKIVLTTVGYILLALYLSQAWFSPRLLCRAIA